MKAKAYTARLCERCGRWIDCTDDALNNDFSHVEAFHPELFETVGNTAYFPFMNWNDEPVEAHAWDEPL